MALRDYQAEDLDALAYEYGRGNSALLGRWATGLGKTHLALHVPQRFEHIIDKYGLLFIVHRREILYQAYDKFKKMYPEKWIGIEMGELHATGYEDFVFVSVDSLGRLMSNRIFKYKKRHFGAVIVDEGHHVTPDSTWDNILNFFGVGSTDRFRLPNGEKILSLFLTATPNRADGVGLAPFIDTVAFDRDVLWGIRNGWLTDIRAFHYRAEGNIYTLARIIRDHAQGEKTLVFAGSVDESMMLADALNLHGFARAGHVDGTTDKELRQQIIDGFRGDEVDVLSNMLVFTEGTDFPGITMIVDNAPTKSAIRRLQKLGRGLRPHPEARVDDYATAAERREAIRRSPKDALKYIATFDPSQYELSIPVVIGGVNVGEEADGKLLVEEIIDVVLQEQEEQPERPVESIIEGVLGVEVDMQEVDLWTQTVYNETLKAVTPLRWVMRGDTASIWLPENPFWKEAGLPKVYSGVPTIVHWQKEGDRYVAEILSGGWNGKFASANRRVRLGTANDLNHGIRRFDKALEKKAPEVHSSLKRKGMATPATPHQISYMKRHGIDFVSTVSESVAEILIDNFRIQRKLQDASAT